MKIQLRIEEFDLEKVANRPADGPKPRPLSFWREKIEGLGGYLPGPDGERVPVSLEPWADADANTMLAIYIEGVDPALVGTVDPNFRPPTR